MAFPIAGAVIWSGVLAFLKNALPTITKEVLKALGIGFLSFTGFTVAWEVVESMVYSRYNGLPLVALQILDLAGVDSAIGMVFATFTGVIAYKALTNATRFYFNHNYNPG